MISHPRPISYIDTGLRLDPANIPDTDENSFCVKGSGATPIADDSMDSDWSVSLFTQADHERICDYCEAYNSKVPNNGRFAARVRQLKCSKPPPAPPLPPAKVECEQNQCSWVHAQQLCSSLQGDDTLYNDCLFDFCLECDDDAAEEEAAEAPMEEEAAEAPMEEAAAGASYGAGASGAGGGLPDVKVTRTGRSRRVCRGGISKIGRASCRERV